MGSFFHGTDYSDTCKALSSGPFLRPRIWGLSLYKIIMYNIISSRGRKIALRILFPQTAKLAEIKIKSREGL